MIRYCMRDCQSEEKNQIIKMNKNKLKFRKFLVLFKLQLNYFQNVSIYFN